MNELQLFQYDSSNIRTILVDDVLYWVAKDICEYFGDTDHKRSVGRLDEDEKTLVKVIDSLGREQTATAVNESGLFALLFNFQPEKANLDGGAQNNPHIIERINKIKAFKKWVTSEVLPQIRKTGKYEIKPKEISRRDLALMVIQLEDEKEAMALQLAEQQPKVDFTNKLLKSKDCILVREFAKVLTDEGFVIGEKELYEWFRKNGYLSYNKNEPFQQYMKYFNVKETPVNTVYGNKLFKTTVVTPEGQLYFFNKISKEFNPLFDKPKRKSNK
jgi:anti-repressor protein